MKSVDTHSRKRSSQTRTKPVKTGSAGETNKTIENKKKILTYLHKRKMRVYKGEDFDNTEGSLELFEASARLLCVLICLLKQSEDSLGIRHDEKKCATKEWTRKEDRTLYLNRGTVQWCPTGSQLRRYSAFHRL